MCEKVGNHSLVWMMLIIRVLLCVRDNTFFVCVKCSFV